MSPHDRSTVHTANLPGDWALGFATHQAGSNPLKTGHSLGQQGRLEGIRNPRCFANQQLRIWCVWGGEVGGEGRGSSANAWGWGGFPCPFFSLRRFSWLDLVPPSPSPLSSGQSGKKERKKIRSMRIGWMWYVSFKLFTLLCCTSVTYVCMYIHVQ